MANKQEVLIYIEKENQVEAEFMSRNFVNKEIKNRAYVNVLGAELLMGYLSSDGIDVSDLNNVHSISKIIENIDISDILLPNIHLDVRVVFDEDKIFVPISHSEMEIEPDAYVVLKLDKEFKYVELLGYFKPSQINKRNKNDEYYFFEKEKLSPADTLTKFVKEFVGKTPRNLSEADFLRGRELSISLADHNISESEEKELMELLLMSRALRESILEFDNFETLSYSAAPMLSDPMSNFTMPSGFQILEEEGEYEDDYEEEQDVVDLSNKFDSFEPLESVEEATLSTMALNETLAFEDVFPDVDNSEEDVELPDATEELEDLSDEVSEEEEDEDEEEELQPFEEFTAFVEEQEIVDVELETLEVGTSDDDDSDVAYAEPSVENVVEFKEFTVEDNLLEDEVSLDMEVYTETLEAAEEDEEESVEEVAEQLVAEDIVAEDDTEDVAVEELEILDENPVLEDIQSEVLIDELEPVEMDNSFEEPVEQIEEFEQSEEVLEMSEEQEVIEDTVLEQPELLEAGVEISDEALTIEEDVVAPVDMGEDEVSAEVSDDIEASIDEEEIVPLDDTVALEGEVEDVEMPEPSLELEETVVESLDLLPEVSEEVSEIETLDIDENVPSLKLDEAPSLEFNQDDLGDDLLGGDLTTEDSLVAETVEESEEEEEVVPQGPVATIEEVYTPSPVGELSVDAILDQTIAAIDSPNIEQGVVEETVEALPDVVTDVVEEVVAEEVPVETVDADLDKAAEATASALADAVANESVNVTVSDDAMNLASVAGDMVNDAVQRLEGSQQANLNKIDYANTDIVSEIDEVPDNLMATADDLSLSKLVANLEAEESGLFAETTDISNLNSVEAYEEEAFVQDTVNFGNMETVSKDKLMEQGFENSEVENLSSFDMPVDNFNLPEVNMGKEEGVVDLPQFSSGGITINDDGSSPMDKMLDMGMAALEEQNSTEGLMDMDMNVGGAPLSPDALDFSSCMKPSTRRKDESRSSSRGESKSTLDEETKKILLSNNITRSSDNDEEEESFGETITIPVDDEPFEIDAPDLGDEVEVNFGSNQDVSSDELSLDEFDALVNELDGSNNSEDVDNSTASQVQPSEIADQQDWMGNNDYAELQDVAPQVQDVADDFITEPDANPKEIVVSENSAIISDRTFRAGEVPIDINNSTAPQFDGPESLQNLYNPNSKVPGGALLQNPGRLGSASQGKGASGLLGVVGTLIVFALVGGIGFGVSRFFKAPTDEVPQPITDEPIPTSTANATSDANTLKIDPNNVVNMDNNYNSLATTSKPAASSSANSAKATQKKGPAKSFVEIKEMKWLLPDYISRNAQFQQYFQSIGKSLKLSLTTDLLLASDYIYSDQMKVALTFGKDGTFQNSQVIVSSGSNQIDRIVLQTVNQTLKTLKAPNSVGNDENTTAVLNISF